MKRGKQPLPTLATKTVTHNVKSLERKRTYASIQTVKEENRTRTAYIRIIKTKG